MILSFDKPKKLRSSKEHNEMFMSLDIIILSFPLTAKWILHLKNGIK